MKKIIFFILGISIVFLLSCEKNYKIDDLILGKWAVTGNNCQENGSCKTAYKFLGKDYYKKNYRNTVLEFKKEGTLFQPILGEGKYRISSGILQLGINFEGKTAWKNIEVQIIGPDDIILKFSKVWRKYSRIEY